MAPRRGACRPPVHGGGRLRGPGPGQRPLSTPDAPAAVKAGAGVSNSCAVCPAGAAAPLGLTCSAWWHFWRDCNAGKSSGPEQTSRGGESSVLRSAELQPTPLYLSSLTFPGVDHVYPMPSDACPALDVALHRARLGRGVSLSVQVNPHAPSEWRRLVLLPQRLLVVRPKHGLVAVDFLPGLDGSG